MDKINTGAGRDSLAELTESDINEREYALSFSDDPKSDIQSTEKSPASPAKIKIRLGTEDDRDAVRSLARWQHGQTIFGDIEFCDEKFDAAFDNWKVSQRFECGLVAVRDGRLVGFLYASCGEFRFGKSALMTTVHVLAVEGRETDPLTRIRAFKALLDAVKQWSKSRGGEHVMVHVTTGVNLKMTDKLLRSCGATVIGGGYLV